MRCKSIEEDTLKGTMRRWGLWGLLTLSLVFGAMRFAYGSDFYLSGFNPIYGTFATVLNACVLCHLNPAGGGPRNPYGVDFASNGHSFTTIEGLDSDGDGFINIVEINTRTFPGAPVSHPLAVVDSFIIPPDSMSLVVPITELTANTITGYMITESAIKPLASAAGWSATAPTTYTFVTAGFKTLHAWTKDAAGNVSSSSVSASTTISLTDATAPVVTAFIVPVTSSSLVVPITTFTATDDVAVTGYLVTESSTKPTPAPAEGWSATAPTTHTFVTAGFKTLHAWTKDAAGNVSSSVSASTTISLADSAFPIPASGGGGQCFIVIAALGSYLNPYVRVLRNFRDTFLVTSRTGKVFVGWYYRVSPPIADTISHGAMVRALVRAGLLPVIGFSALALSIGLVPSALVMCLVVAGIGLAISRLRSYPPQRAVKQSSAGWTQYFNRNRVAPLPPTTEIISDVCGSQVSAPLLGAALRYGRCGTAKPAGIDRLSFR